MRRVFGCALASQAFGLEAIDGARSRGVMGGVDEPIAPAVARPVIARVAEDSSAAAPDAWSVAIAIV